MEISRNPLSRLAFRHLSKTLERYEKDVLKDLDAIVAISEQEAQGYREWGYQGPIHLAGFGIEMSAPLTARPAVEGRAMKLFHLGAMDWGPNREGIDWFVQSIWPAIRAAHPGTEFHIAGKGLNPSEHAGVAGVFNHGEVEDAQLFSQSYDLLVVPLLRGAGIRVKIVDALAHGIPVATTNKGALGLDMEGSGAFIHAEPEGLAAALSDLIAHLIDCPSSLSVGAPKWNPGLTARPSGLDCSILPRTAPWLTGPRLAVVTPRFPFPLNKGDRLRIHHQLKVLHGHFHIDLPHVPPHSRG